jgi:hypothetical protein
MRSAADTLPPKILLSICSQVRKSSAMAMVAERIGAMMLQTELGTPREKWSTEGFFAADVARLLQNFWEVGRTGAAIPTVGVSVFWSDPQGRVLFGTIDEWHRGKRRPKKIYSSETLRLPSRAWRRVGLHPVADGGRHVRFAVAAAGI